MDQTTVREGKPVATRKSVSKKKKMTIPEAVDKIARVQKVHLEGCDQEVEVHVCKLQDIPDFLALIAEVYDDVGISLGNAGAIEAAVAEKLNDGHFLLKLISKNWDKTLDVLSKLTSMSKEDIGELDLDDAVMLAKKVAEVNFDFFTKRVLPLIPGVLAERLSQRVERT